MYSSCIVPYIRVYKCKQWGEIEKGGGGKKRVARSRPPVALICTQNSPRDLVYGYSCGSLPHCSVVGKTIEGGSTRQPASSGIKLKWVVVVNRHELRTATDSRENNSSKFSFPAYSTSKCLLSQLLSST